MCLLMIEVKKEEDGYRASVVEIGTDAVLFVSDSYPDVSDAVRATSAWMEEND